MQKLFQGSLLGNISNPTVEDNKTTDGTGTGSFTSSITGLNIGIEYHLRAYATNRFGNSYGDDEGFVAGSSAGKILTMEGTATVNINLEMVRSRYSQECTYPIYLPK